MNVKRSAFLFYWILVISLAFSLPSFATNQPKSEDGTVQINRLVALCKLWGYVKYFHPSLAYRSEIDWDAALIATIPKVRSAKTSDEYAAVMQGLLDVLGDPLTRITHNSASATIQKENDNQPFAYQLTEDDILVITVGNYFRLWDQANQEKLKAVLGEIPKASALVFDLRSVKPVGDYGKLQLTSVFSQIERLISTAPLLTTGERSRVYKGFEGNAAFSSGQYISGFYNQNVKRITPAPNAKDIPSVFLLNKNSGLPDSTIALQAGGKGLVVFNGTAKDSAFGRTQDFDLGEGVSAQVRQVEMILEDSRNGDLQVDVIVPVSQKDTDEGLKAALALARNFKPSTLIRKTLPSTIAPPRDKSYPEMKYPSSEYRLLAAFRIWNIIDYFFPYKRLMGEDWQSVLREFIPKFEQAKDALEYSLVAAEMMTHIHDSHAYVSGSTLNEYFGTGYPPIRVRLIENSLVVTHFYNESIARLAGIEIGDIVLTVDGEDAKARLARYAKYISASTLQNNMDKASLGFMNGKDKSVVTLTLRNRAQQVKEVKLVRSFEDFTTLYHRERSGDILKLLPGNIGYADLDRLTIEMIDDMLERFKNTKAIIFDMRGYPNVVFWFLAPRLAQKQGVAAALLETPLVGPAFTANSSESFFQMIQPPPPDKWLYKGKTVMLIDERAISQSEHTGVFLRAANGTVFIGSRTAGANGEITNFSIPGGIGIGLSGQSVKFPDGKQLQRLGLTPDVEIKPTIKGIQEGRDEVLDGAIRYLHQVLKK
jgi:C-terminal processing protease CtpA/Prc